MAFQELQRNCVCDTTQDNPVDGPALLSGGLCVALNDVLLSDTINCADEVLFL
jgi:hypothetical protein